MTASAEPTEKRVVRTRRVVQLGHEALVEVAQAVDQVVVARFGGDDLRRRGPSRAGSGRRPSGCRWCRGPATKWVIGGQVGEDLRAGGGVVRAGVGGVAVLVEHHPVGVLGGQFLGDADGGVGAARRRARG